jgi:hypothetical protein
MEADDTFGCFSFEIRGDIADLQSHFTSPVRRDKPAKCCE